MDLRASFPPNLRLVQFVSDLVYGDAVAADCLQFHRTFERWGLRSVIHAARLDSHHQAVGHLLADYRPTPDDLVVFHYSCWSDSAEYLLRLGQRLVLIYHNVTPPEYFAGTDPAAAEVSRRGREALPRFAPLTDLGLGDSEYNRQELEAAGFRRTGVLPILVDLARLDTAPNEGVLRAFRDRGTKLLFLGRVVPNKRHDDLIKALYHYDRLDPAAQLIIVGSHDVYGPYCQWLQALAARLGLAGRVHFTGQVPTADLVAYFRLAQVYLCLSDHEGFCVPLVEAMHLGLPVVAYAATAVPHTLGDAGILVRRKDPAVIAELIHLATTDRTLRDRLVARGQERAAAFSRERVESTLAAHLQTVLQRVSSR